MTDAALRTLETSSARLVNAGLVNPFAGAVMLCLMLASWHVRQELHRVILQTTDILVVRTSQVVGFQNPSYLVPGMTSATLMIGSIAAAWQFKNECSWMYSLQALSRACLEKA